MSKPAASFIEVVCALLESEDGGRRTVWAAQRATGAHAGKWEFPGGKVEPHELPSEALSREIAEELDCALSILEVMPHYDHDYGQGPVIRLMPFLCRCEGIPYAKEHRALKQVTADECDTLDWAEADLPIVRDWQLRAKQPG